MSKSDPSDATRINLSDDADAIAHKIRRARTDPDPLPETADGLDGRPEAANLVGIYAALADRPVADVLGEFAGQGFAAFKAALAEVAIETLAPIGRELARLESDAAYLDRVLADGAERARAIADPVVERVYEIVGLTAG